MRGLIYDPAAMIADADAADAITRAAEGITGGRLKVVDVKTTVARRIAAILVAALVVDRAIPAAMVAVR